MTLYIGIDASLGRTGLAFLRRQCKAPSATVQAIVPPPLRCGARLAWLSEALFAAIDRQGLSIEVTRVVVAMETYAVRAVGQLTGLAEWGGCIRAGLAARGIDVLGVNPMTLKLWATGNGRADKEVMAISVKQQARAQGIAVSVPAGKEVLDDEWDALALAMLLERRVNGFQAPALPKGTRLTETQRRAYLREQALWTPSWETAQGQRAIIEAPARPRLNRDLHGLQNS